MRKSLPALRLPTLARPRWTTQRTIWAYVFVLFPFLYLILGNIGTMLVSFSYSFQQYSLMSKNRPWIGLENYQRILSDDKFFQALVNTLQFGLVRAPVQLILALIVALLLQRCRRAKGLYRMLYFMPFVTSGVAVSWVWKYMYAPDFGIVTPLLQLLGLGRISVLGTPSTALYGVVAFNIWGSVGYYALIFLAGLEDIPSTYYEAARVDGASPWQSFMRITLPLLNRTIVLVGVLLLIASLNTFMSVRMLTGGGPLGATRTLPLMIYEVGFGSSHMGRASAIAVIFFMIVLSVTLVQRRLLTKQYDT